MNPRARVEGVLAEQVEDELVVYDLTRDRAHRLNKTATFVWRHADGRRSIAELAVLLRRDLDQAADEDLVWCALDRLSAARLLEEPRLRSAKAVQTSRRQFVRKVGLVGTVSLLLPVVTSIVVPTPADAQSACSPAPSFTPLQDVSVTENSPPTVITMQNASGAPPLTFSITVNTNPGLVTASLNGTQLTLTYTQNMSGTALITIRLTADGGETCFVEDQFTVDVTG